MANKGICDLANLTPIINDYFADKDVVAKHESFSDYCRRKKLLVKEDGNYVLKVNTERSDREKFNKYYETVEQIFIAKDNTYNFKTKNFNTEKILGGEQSYTAIFSNLTDIQKQSAQVESVIDFLYANRTHFENEDEAKDIVTGFCLSAGFSNVQIFGGDYEKCKEMCRYYLLEGAYSPKISNRHPIANRLLVSIIGALVFSIGSGAGAGAITAFATRATMKAEAGDEFLGTLISDEASNIQILNKASSYAVYVALAALLGISVVALIKGLRNNHKTSTKNNLNNFSIKSISSAQDLYYLPIGKEIEKFITENSKDNLVMGACKRYTHRNRSRKHLVNVIKLTEKLYKIPNPRAKDKALRESLSSWLVGEFVEESFKIASAVYAKDKRYKSDIIDLFVKSNVIMDLLYGKGNIEVGKTLHDQIKTRNKIFGAKKIEQLYTPNAIVEAFAQQLFNENSSLITATEMEFSVIESDKSASSKGEEPKPAPKKDEESKPAPKKDEESKNEEKPKDTKVKGKSKDGASEEEVTIEVIKNLDRKKWKINVTPNKNNTKIIITAVDKLGNKKVVKYARSADKSFDAETIGRFIVDFGATETSTISK